MLVSHSRPKGGGMGGFVAGGSEERLRRDGRGSGILCIHGWQLFVEASCLLCCRRLDDV